MGKKQFSYKRLSPESAMVTARAACSDVKKTLQFLSLTTVIY